jgi:ferredoxin-NADP reductase
MGSYFPSLYASLRYRPIISIIACASALGTGYYAPLYYDNYKRRSQPTLNSQTFTPFTLIAKHKVSASSSIFVLRPPPNNDATQQLATVWDADSLWSVQAKQPQLQIGREYTPIPPTDVLSGQSLTGDGSADIHLLIRREKNGEMTTYLHGLQPPTATVHLRGPYQDVKLPQHVDEVLFIAGGTGISPALQVAHIMSRRPGAKVTILWANRRRDECVQAPISKDSVASSGRWWWGGSVKTVDTSSIQKKDQAHEGAPHEDKGLVVRIIEEMQARTPNGNLRVEYFIDEEDSFIKHTDVRKILSRSEADASAAASIASKERTNIKPVPISGTTSAAIPSGSAIASAATRESTTSLPQPKTGGKLILVSGPNGFVDYWAGRKRMSADGKEIQGPLGGALGEMDLNGWKVWKL